jgi:hypothetical protein
MTEDQTNVNNVKAAGFERERLQHVELLVANIGRQRPNSIEHKFEDTDTD